MATALAGGAHEFLLVPTVDDALSLAQAIPGAIVCAEEAGVRSSLDAITSATANDATAVNST